MKNAPFTLKLKSQLFKNQKNIGFAQVILDTLGSHDNFWISYGLQMLDSSISYQLPHIYINFSILLNFGNLPDFYDRVVEQEFPESLSVKSLDLENDNYEHSSLWIDEFLQKLKVAHTEIQFIGKNVRKQREAREFQELVNWLLYQSINPLMEKEFWYFTKKFDKPCNEQIESLTQSLDPGMRNAALVIEKYQFIMNFQLKIPVKCNKRNQNSSNSTFLVVY